MEQITQKKCSECGEIKLIYEFDKTMSGKRYEPMCKTCKNSQFEPKKPPKIVGMGKPIWGFQGEENRGKVNRKENYDIKKLVHNRGDEMREKLLKDINEYTEKNGDGFTAKELAQFINEVPTTLYYWFDVLVKEKELFRVDGITKRFFRHKRNYKYWVKRKPGRRNEKLQQEVLKDIKEGNISNTEKNKKTPPPVDKKIKGRIRETMKKETKNKDKVEDNKVTDVNEVINNLIDSKVEEIKKEIITKLEKMEEKIELITPGNKDIKSNVKKVLEDMLK